MNEEAKKTNMFENAIVQSVTGIAVVFIILGAFLFWQSSHGTVFIEKSEVNAPIIDLSPSSAGTLNALYVKEGDTVAADTPVALVGTGVVTAKEPGIVISVENNIGEFFAPGQTIISMVHPEDMRIIGTIDENKGLDKIHPGERATFTVDAFGGKTYVGVVDSVSQTANDTGVAFSISDKRPTMTFDVKVRFNVADYPELKNGMSAKITVYTG